MNIKSIYVFILLVIISSNVYSQTILPSPILGGWTTNTYYNAKEITFELTPTISANNLFNLSKSQTYGISFEYEYWQSLTTGTGLELGSYDLHANSFDHISIMEDYRLVYLPNTFLFDKFAAVVKIGAETYFVDGTKGLEIGFGINYNLFIKNLRVETSIMQHFRTDSSKDGSTLRIGIQSIF